jgi:phosphatidylcholine synthase
MELSTSTETHTIARKQQAAAWLVHFYTATGGVIGMFALFAAVNGQIREAFLLLLITMVIDGTDGIMARRARVSEVLPNFSGAEVDNVVDFLNFVWIPVFIMGTQNLLPNIVWIAVPVFAALYAYGQVNMKTPDAFFLGFPSYWNVVALYMFWLRPEPFWAVFLVVFPAILTFIPTRYLYPSKNRHFQKMSWVLGAIWLWMLILLLTQEQPDMRLVWVSLFFPVYYMVVSFYLDLKLRRDRRRAAYRNP